MEYLGAGRRPAPEQAGRAAGGRRPRGPHLSPGRSGRAARRAGGERVGGNFTGRLRGASPAGGGRRPAAQYAAFHAKLAVGAGAGGPPAGTGALRRKGEPGGPGPGGATGVDHPGLLCPGRAGGGQCGTCRLSETDTVPRQRKDGAGREKVARGRIRHV